MIEIIHGILGGSKSWTATSRIISYLKRGASVVTNIELLEPGITAVCGADAWKRCTLLVEKSDIYKFYTFAKTGDEQHNLVVIDEAHKLWDARDFAKTKRDCQDVLDWLDMSRRFRNDIIFITHRPAKLDSRIVGSAEIFTKCKDWSRLPVVGFFWKGFYEATYDADQKTRLKGKFKRKDPSVGLCYNTNQAVMKISGADEVSDIKGKHSSTVGRGVSWRVFVPALLVLFGLWMGYGFWQRLKSKGQAAAVAPAAAAPAAPVRYVQTPELLKPGQPAPADDKSDVERFLANAPYLVRTGTGPGGSINSGSLELRRGLQVGRWDVLDVDASHQVWLRWSETGEVRMLRSTSARVDPVGPQYRPERVQLKANPYGYINRSSGADSGNPQPASDGGRGYSVNPGNGTQGLNLKPQITGEIPVK